MKKTILFFFAIAVVLAPQGFCDSKHYRGIVSYLIDVAKGNINGETIMNKFGGNSSLTTSTDSQTVWPGSGFYPFTPDTAQAMEARSTSTEDSGAVRMSGTVSGNSTTTTIIDTSVNFIDSGVVIKDLFVNTTNDEFSVITAVDSFQLTLLGMTNGSQVQPRSNNNDKGDTYNIIHAVGTGAAAIVTYGLDSNWLFQNEITVLKGSSDTVDLTKKYIRQWRSVVLIAGSNEGAVGDLIVSDSGGGDTACIIIDGANQTQQSFFTIPGDKKGYFLQGYVSLGKGGGATAISARFSWRARPYGGVKNINGELEIINTGPGYWQYAYKGAPALPPRTDVEIICEFVSGTVGVQAGMDILLSDL